MSRALILLACLALPAAAADAVKPIRGAIPIPETNSSESYRIHKNDRLVPRSHDWQPPVIPHGVKGYQITRNVNMCMTCHSRSAAPASGATPVGKSHYVDRDGRHGDRVSARRYFCLQCHAPQFDAEPLVGSDFRGPK